jgi:hypothetical protein
MSIPWTFVSRDCGGVSPISVVIPGRRKAASPESITTIVSMDSGLAPRGAPRNDEGEFGARKLNVARELFPL